MVVVVGVAAAVAAAPATERRRFGATPCFSVAPLRQITVCVSGPKWGLNHLRATERSATKPSTATLARCAAEDVVNYI